jgi:chemotaxis protein MotB
MAKRNRVENDSSGSNVGLVMMLSLFLILLTFFILLNSIATMDERRTRVAIGSLMGAFGIFKGGTSPLGTGDNTMSPFAPKLVDTANKDDLLSLIDKKMMGELKIELKKDRGIITIQEETLLDDTTLRIKPSAKPLLDQLCRFINRGAYPLEIVGHTDNRPAEEKGYKSNWALSTLTAIRVLRYMVEKGHVQHGRVEAHGKGDQNPLTSNDTRKSRAQNRRIDIILDYKAQYHVRRIFKDKKSAFITYKKFDFKIK